MDEQNTAGVPAPDETTAAQSDEELCGIKDVTKSYESRVAAEIPAVNVTNLPITGKKVTADEESLITRTADRSLFAYWIALTTAERIEEGLPETQTGMAERLGVTRMSLWRWKQEPGFQCEVSRKLRARCQQHAPALIDKMNEKGLAGEGDVSAAEAVLRRAMPDEKPGTAVAVQVNVSTAELVGSADEDAPLPEWSKAKSADAIDVEVIDGATEKGGEDEILES